MLDKWTVLGIMSGSSLDGLDLAYCEFILNDNQSWQYQILQAETIPFSGDWIAILKSLPSATSEDLANYDLKFGKLLGEICHAFILKYKLQPYFIASHGHTIFHQPQLGYTFQLGNGQAIATTSGLEVIADFRTKDVLLGGEGAPLVPIGDQLLFSDFKFCLNIGGIANISFEHQNKRVAFDICPANQLLNHLSLQIGRPYDKNGKIAQTGELLPELFHQLNDHPYYKKSAPKSLGNEDVRNSFLNSIDAFHGSVNDKLHTVCKHIAHQIHQSTVEFSSGEILVTGGGAYNSFLIKMLRELSEHKLAVPGSRIVEFKEALIFAFMGVKRKRNEVNCLASVTGASRDSCSGVIFRP